MGVPPVVQQALCFRGSPHNRGGCHMPHCVRHRDRHLLDGIAPPSWQAALSQCPVGPVEGQTDIPSKLIRTAWKSTLATLVSW